MTLEEAVRIRYQDPEYLGRRLGEIVSPYDYRSLIEVFLNTERTDYIHDDFPNYYGGLKKALEGLFGIEICRPPFEVGIERQVFWGLFQQTADSMLCLRGPWDHYLEAGLIHTKLEAAGTQGEEVYRASAEVGGALGRSLAAHRTMLFALFPLIFGEVSLIVTSADLSRIGFDDSSQPSIYDNKYDELW